MKTDPTPATPRLAVYLLLVFALGASLVLMGCVSDAVSSPDGPAAPAAPAPSSAHPNDDSFAQSNSTAAPPLNPSAQTPVNSTPAASPSEKPSGSDAAWSLPSGHRVDLTRLPIGDDHHASSPTVGEVYACPGTGQGGGAQGKASWDNGDGTYDLTRKVSVRGNVSWGAEFREMLDGAARLLQGNGLPAFSGIFPIARTDPAHAYDGNPNSVKAQDLDYRIPADPQAAAQPGCLRDGPIGVAVDGVYIYDALDAEARDAGFHETQDLCEGHPQGTGQYHYHTGSPCISAPAPGEWKLVGWALDGFGIYDYRDPDGLELTNADLDECHGRVDVVPWDGGNVSMYHYVLTREFPYTLGCYKGTPVSNGLGSGSARNLPSDASPSGSSDASAQSSAADAPSPPQAAYEACDGKSPGASCAFSTPRGTVSGTCETPQGTALCVPAR